MADYIGLTHRCEMRASGFAVIYDEYIELKSRVAVRDKA
jgi:hypothetical protein